MSANRVCTTVLSLTTVRTSRRAAMSPRLANVISFSAWGRSRFAFAWVVLMRPWVNRARARLAMIRRSWLGLPPRRGPLVGVGMASRLLGRSRSVVRGGRSVLAQAEPELLELLAHLVDGLLAEV